jgi:SAM-dependent methyltransferase
MARTLYDDKFYSQHGDQSLESARIVAPLVLRLARIKSVIDVGCGIGGWLRAFVENGVPVIRGVDGSHVDLSKLYFESDLFTAIDLRQPLKLEGQYDLAICLEVVEHLDCQSGRALVQALTDLAPLILFSAAVPGQGGVGHINEQWPSYWGQVFAQYGFKMLDVIRPAIREDRRIKWWYRQNIVIFAAEAALSANPALHETLNDDKGLEWIHINMLCSPHAGVRNLMVHFKPLLGEAIGRRLPGMLTRARRSDV